MSSFSYNDIIDKSGFKECVNKMAEAIYNNPSQRKGRLFECVYNNCRQGKIAEWILVECRNSIYKFSSDIHEDLIDNKGRLIEVKAINAIDNKYMEKLIKKYEQGYHGYKPNEILFFNVDMYGNYTFYRRHVFS